MRQIFTDNFVGGLAWGIGMTIGLSFLLGFLTFLVQQMNVVPYVGDFVSKIYDYILANNPNL